MGVTFLIGNGFDLNLGMETRYTDMYDSYIKSKSNSPIIEKFKKDLQREEHDHYEKWCDFEMGMARYASNYTNENEFVECIRDFKAHMVGCLRAQEEKKLDDIWIQTDFDEFKDSITGFFSGLTPNAQYQIENVLSVNKLHYIDFISFNYTKVLDDMLSEISSKPIGGANATFRINSEVIHVHGDLDNDVVLGVDNETQIQATFNVSEKLQQAFIKPIFNNKFDYRRIQKAVGVISKSSVLCIYGLSLGESDKSWVEIIKEWLLSDDKHHIVYYVYDENVIPAFNFDLRMEKEIDLKQKLIRKMNLSSDESKIVSDRIHIPVSCNIFDSIKAEKDNLVTV